MDAATVNAMLEQSFPLLPIPSMSPRQAHLADQTLTRRISPEEWTTAGQPDANRTWREFTDDELIEHHAALPHFDEDSFVYYLPAYLRFALSYCDVDSLSAASGLKTSTIFSVTDTSTYSLGRYKRLSPAQCAAVVSFLEFMAEHADPFNAPLARKALTRYWRTDAASRPLIIVP